MVKANQCKNITDPKKRQACLAKANKSVGRKHPKPKPKGPIINPD